MSNPTDTTRRVRYYSLLDGSGYGSAAFSYMEGLTAHGIEVIWSPIVYTRFGLAPWALFKEPYRCSLLNNTKRQDRFARTIESTQEYDTVIMHVMPELFPKLVEQGKRNIGNTVWETDRLPDHWLTQVLSVDHLIVPCHNNQALFSVENGPEVSVVPHINEFEGVQIKNHYRGQFRQEYIIQDSTYVFYNISTWSPRKAIYDTLHSYLRAFTADDDVCLVLKTDEKSQDYTSSSQGKTNTTRNMLDNILKQYSSPATVVLIDQYIEQDQMLMLHAACDCYFSLAHSEGWGLGAYDAAYFGRPVIITAWGGQTDYLPADVAYLVDYKLESVKARLNWESYSTKQKWAHADINHAIELLTYVFGHQDGAAQSGAKLAHNIAKGFSRDVITKKLLSVIYDNNT